MTAGELAERVGAEPLGGGGWQVRCPAHEDRKPSLSIASGDDGRVLLKCHAGCDVEAVCAAWGITTSDLFPRNNGNGAGRRVAATYPYVDEAGNLLCEVVRFEPKDFRQRHPDGRGGWTWNLKGVRRVLYRLDELAGADEVFIVEGEKDADNLRALRFTATTVPGGAGKWRAEYAEHFNADQHVVILPDNDDAGRAGAQLIAEALHGVVASVKVLELPDLPPKGDVSDFIARCNDLEAAAERLALLAEDAPTWEPADGTDAEQASADPTIEIRPDLTGVTDEAIAAVASRPELGVYVRGRQLVRVARDGSPPERWLKRWPGSPVIVPLSPPQILDVLDRAATWVKYDGRAKANVPAIPPSWAAQQVASRLAWQLPYLEAVTETPTIRADGSILDTPGWDEATGLLYEPIPGAAEWPSVPDTPTADDLEAAYATLVDPIQDFPFVAESDRAAAVAVVLTLIGRHLIPGPVPLFAIRAPTPGTGKTLLADVLGLIGTGRVPPAMPMTFDAEELRKRITALAVEGAPVILMDNVSGTLGSDTLAAALTATEWEDRILGTNTVVRVPLRVVWIATGNNLGFRRTLGRRVIPIDLDAQVEMPEDRTGFRYAELKAHVRRARPRLVAAALTLLRAFHVAGRPSHGGARMGSFEQWDDNIRSAVMFTGLDDPASAAPNEGRGRVRSQADDDTETLSALLRALFGQWPDAAFSAADTITAMTRNDELRAAVDVAATARGGKPTARSLGYAFRSACDRPVAGLVLRRWGQGRSGVQWHVESVEGGPR